MLRALILDEGTRSPRKETIVTSSMPSDGVLISLDIQPEGEAAKRREHQASIDIVSDTYFHVIRIPLRSGRLFDASDSEGSTPVAVVSESVANRYFQGKPIGRRIILPLF